MVEPAEYTLPVV